MKSWRNWTSCLKKSESHEPGSDVLCRVLTAASLASPPGFTMEGAGAVRGADASAAPEAA